VLANTVERVPQNTPEEINERIARETNRRVNFYAANPIGIERRLRELDEEWDIERVLEANAASVAFACRHGAQALAHAAGLGHRLSLPACGPGLVPACAGLASHGLPNSTRDRDGANRLEGAAR